jgi:hypothetical protein
MFEDDHPEPEIKQDKKMPEIVLDKVDSEVPQVKKPESPKVVDAPKMMQVVAQMAAEKEIVGKFHLAQKHIFKGQAN